MDAAAIVDRSGIARVGAPETRSGRRLPALDVFRGLSVAGMILVTDPGTYAAVYPPLLHANWRGATATDMIFPAFLFAVGIAIPMAMRSRLERGRGAGQIARGVLRRVLVLVVIGLVLNGYPRFHLATLRLPGVLQRIGLCYGAAALLWLGMRGLKVRQRCVSLGLAAGGLLLLYGAMLLLVPAPGYGAGHLDTLRSLPAAVDRAVFGVPHLWAYGMTPGVGVTFDPEGILSTLSAIASTLVGVIAGELLLPWEADATARPGVRLLWAAAVGVLLFAAGLLLDPVMPIIKKLWTPSFALLSSGVAMMAFVAVSWVVAARGLRRVLLPLRVFGSNAIVAFALSGVLTSTLDVLHVGSANWHAWGYAHLFLPWLAPVNASLAYALVVVGVNCAVLGVLYRRGVFLRV